jgi:hypothetical protein
MIHLADRPAHTTQQHGDSPSAGSFHCGDREEPIMRKTRTEHPPVLRLRDEQWRRFSWTATIKIGSSGYATGLHVEAIYTSGEDTDHGFASCDLEPGDDLRIALEACAVEASLQCHEPVLDGLPQRVAKVSRSALFQ